MKNENNFPNIKPVELKEEQTDTNKNKEENKIDKDKENNKNKCINEKIKNISFCFFYFIFFFLIISYFVFNYFHAKNAFDENKNIMISADKLCNEKINNLTKCFKEKANKKCINEEKYLETCYEQVNLFNQKCYVFISELELCYRKNNKSDKNNKCKNIEKNLILCGARYKNFSLKNITNLKNLFTLN